MTDARRLLERHRPRLVYDSQEAYFADAAAVWTDAPTNALKRVDGTMLAKPPELALGFLGPHVYGDGTKVLGSDVIGESTRDYAEHAAAMHRMREYANRVHGHARRDAQGRLWLQYWLFYYYNDFQLLGPLLRGGKHEGDWELVQLRLNASEQPEQAVYSQHSRAESRAWADVRKVGPAPLVYVARGSHANYFRPGSHWTGVWFDQADGRGPQITPALEVVSDTTAWMLWPGRWGDTKATNSPVDSTSPNSPGRRPHWLNPALLTEARSRATGAGEAGAAPRGVPVRPGEAGGAPSAAAPPPPRVTAARRGDRLVVAYEAPPDASALVVALRPAGSDLPARTCAFALDGVRGKVELPAPDGELDVWTSVVRPDGSASEGVTPL